MKNQPAKPAKGRTKPPRDRSRTLTRPASTDLVSIRFVVTVPDSTPLDAPLYVCGSTPQLGQWNSRAVPLIRRDARTADVTVRLTVGRPVEYKITRGTWDAVECAADGNSIENHVLTPSSDHTEAIDVAAWSSDQISALDQFSHPKGTVLVFDLDTPHVESPRRIAVYVPHGYEQEVNLRYPVLYMQDGQNLFDPTTAFGGVDWRVDETADRLIAERRIPPMIIVGIYNSDDRIEEYTPWPDDKGEEGGDGDYYIRFLTEQVKPFMDRNFRTLPDRVHTGIAGSSLGGLISLYACSVHPHVFGRCAAISPSLWWADQAALRSFSAASRWMKGIRFWIDMGTSEAHIYTGRSEAAINHTRDLIRLFDRAGLLPGRDYYHAEVFGAAHNENDWAERFDKVLLYLFGEDTASQHSHLDPAP